MIKFNQYFNAVLLSLVLLLFTMCNSNELDFNDIELPAYTGTLALPGGETPYTIEDLLIKLEDPNISINTDNNGLLSVSYSDTTLFDDYLSIIELEDITNPGVINANLDPINGSPGPENVVIPTQDLSFEYSSPNDEELDSVKYTAGQIILDIDNEFGSEVNYELTLTDIVSLDTGEPMVLSGTMPANGSDQVTNDLANHKTIIVQDNSGSSNINVFSGEFDATLIIKTGDFIFGTEEINYTLSITGADFSEIYGWFGDKTIDIQSQSIEMDFFEDISENGLKFSSPQLNLYIDNYFGVPMGLNLDDISATNPDGKTVNLSGDATTTPQFVRAPSTEQVGEFETSLIKVDETNSNIPDLFAISPNLFTVKIDAASNYNNDSETGDRNFVASSSEVEVITEINLPLIVQLNSLERNFGTGIESFDFEDADEIGLVLTTINQLPFEGTMDMQFLAADSSVLFEFLDVAFMKSPEIPVSGKIEEPMTEKDTVLVAKGNGYEELLAATILNIKTNLTSYDIENDTYVKIFSDYELILKVGVLVKANHEL